MKKPVITILMPARNAGNTIIESIKSIINQTHTDWKLVIINDASTDDTLKKSKAIEDNRIEIVSNSTCLGIARSLNQAIDNVETKYIARMDADDLALPDRLTKQIDFLEKNSECDLVGSDVFLSELKNKNKVSRFKAPETHIEITKKPWMGFYLIHPTWTGKTSWFKHFNYKEGHFCCEDQELLLRAYRESKFANINKPLLVYRVKKVRFKKAVKTRLSMLRFQFNFFKQGMEVNNILLCTIAACLKVMKDAKRNSNIVA